MSKNSYLSRIESLLSRWDVEIDGAKDTASRLESKVRDEIDGVVTEFRAKAAELKREMEKSKAAGDRTWDSFRTEVDGHCRDLVAAGQRIVERVESAVPSDGAAERSRYFLSPSPSGGWDLKKMGVKRSTKHFASKVEGLAYSRRYVRRQEPSQLVVRRQDGTIQTAHCYGR